MPIVIDCPACSRKLRVGDDLQGRPVKCPTCGQVFTATSVTPAPKQAPADAIPLLEEVAPPSAGSADKLCYECGALIKSKAVICPKCGCQQPQTPDTMQPQTNRIAVGIVAILIGQLGIHKFMMGMPTPGIIVLLITVLTCGMGGMATGIIGIIEGIMYLTKSDSDFHRDYVINKKEWF